MDNIETLTGVQIKVPSGYIESFYVKNRAGTYYLGHLHGKVGETHEVRISEQFYKDFMEEQERQKLKFI